MVVKDEREPDSEQRYKALVDHTGGNRLHYSADGYRWTEGVLVNPDRLPEGGTNPGRFGDRRNLFHDELETDPARRWKVFGRHCFGTGLLSPRYTRRTCRYWSPDLIRWTPDPQNPILQPPGRIRGGAASHVGLDRGPVLRRPVRCLGCSAVESPTTGDEPGRPPFVHVFDGVPAVAWGPPGPGMPAGSPLQIFRYGWMTSCGSTIRAAR